MEDRLVVAAQFHDQIEANIARTMLEDHEIECRLNSELSVNNNPIFGESLADIKLMVRASHLEAAGELLRDMDEAKGDSLIDFDWDEDEEGDEENDRLVSSRLSCPECAGTRIGLGSLVHWYWSLVIFVVIGPIFLPRTAVTGWLVDYPMVVLSIGVVGGILLGTLRLFPRRCKECGFQGMHKKFLGNQ
ncbi:MAG: putative signal transducing protein [Persicimonas sp.]